MRSSFLVCAAVVGVGLVTGLSPLAKAADPKSNGNKKKGGGDSLSEDKVIGKQLQWEEKVMGADDKRGELDKILKAQAINKAATEKAERDKEKLAKEQAAKDAAAERDAKKNKKSGEVALPTLSDEESSGGKSDKGKSTEISPKLDTAAAAAPPPPSKPADDKFIDKLLKEDGGSKKKKATASTGDNKELIDILAGEKKDKNAAAKGKSAKKDSVDALLLEVDKPAAPAPKIKHETPEWAKPEIRAVPTAAPVVARPQPKRDDGIIHVVQGAAPTSRTAAPPPAPRMAPPPPLTPAGRKQAGATARGGSGDWDDPFSDTPRKAAASRNVTARSNRAAAADFDEDEAPAPRRGSAAAKRESARSAASTRNTRADDESWDDPFTGGGNRKAAPRREAPATKPAKSTGSDSPRPARGGAWKDPFTEAQGAGSKRETALTKREAAGGKRGAAVAVKSSKGAARNQSDDGAKWESAGRKSPSPALAEAGSGHARWGVIKKR